MLVVVVFLCVLAVIADRVSVALAQSAVASRLQEDLALTAKPSVTAHGFPFLTQVAAGRYGDVEVRAAGITIHELTGITVHADLRGLHAPLSQLISGNLSELPVDQLTGTVTLPYQEVVSLAGVGGLSLSQEGDGVRVQGQVTVLGQQLTATALAQVTVRNGTIMITAGQAKVLGVRLPSALLSLVARGLSFALSVPRLPLGLQLTGVRSAAGALEVAGQADHVVLQPGLISTSR